MKEEMKDLRRCIMAGEQNGNFTSDKQRLTIR